MNELIYKFISYFISENVKEIKSVDLFFDQFNTEETGETDVLPNPKVLIEVQESEDIRQDFGNVQILQVPVVLHLGIDIYGGFSNKSTNQEKNFAYLSLLDKLYVELNQITTFDLPTDLQLQDVQIVNVERFSQELATNPGAIKVSTLGFMFTIQDDRTNKGNETTETTLEDSNISGAITH